MKMYRMRVWILGLAMSAAALGAVPTAEAANVVVIKSKDISAYNNAVTAFNLVCKANIKEYNMEGKEERGRKIAELVNANPPDLVFAVGVQAAILTARRIDDDIPFVFTMVRDYERAKLKTDRSSGVSMLIPAGQLLKAVKSIVPDTARVGVVYNPKKSRTFINEATQAARKMGIQLVSAKVDRKEDTSRALRSSFIAGIDALWMIQDPTVATEEAFMTMLDYANTNKVPFIAFAESMVEGGALASLDVNSENLGSQVGHMANRILLGANPETLPVEDPKKLNLSINLDTARNIGRECDIALNIFTYAARNEYAIKAIGGQ